MAAILFLGAHGAGGVAHRRPPYFRGTKKLGIIGSTQNNQHAPWHDKSWVLISHTCSRPDCKREPDWYFDLHRRSCFTARKRWNPEYHQWLKHLQTPIFMQDEWKEIPMAVRYPIERVQAEYGTSVHGGNVFTNHVSYMFPLAMAEGIETIGLFGCQYSAADDRGPQRDTLLYWMGRYEQWGGKLVIPAPNTLLAIPKGLYGYESHDERGKLVPEYTAVRTTAAAAPTPTLREQGAVVIDPRRVEGRPELTPPPNGEAIAWDRSGLAVAG